MNIDELESFSNSLVTGTEEKSASTLFKQPFNYSLTSLTILSISFVATLLTIISFSLSKSIEIPSFHLDGAYQAASGLYRLAASQLPGRDFFPYLGIGPLYSLYPFFVAVGGNIKAASFSTHFVTLCVAWFSCAIFIFFSTKNIRWGHVLTLSMLFTCSTLVSLPYLKSDVLIQNMTPGNSLRSVRAHIAFLSILLAYFVLTEIKTDLHKYILLGVITGVSFSWSNDFGIPSVLGMLMVFFFANWKKPFHEKIHGIAIIIGIATITGAFLITLSTGFHPLSLLLYNFRDVAHDQWWYFGPWHCGRIIKLGDAVRIYKNLSCVPFLALTIGPFLVVMFILRSLRQRASMLDLIFCCLGLVLLLGGLLPSAVGHFDIGYWNSFIIWFFFAVWSIIFSLVKKTYTCSCSITNRNKIVFVQFIICLFTITSSIQQTIALTNRYSELQINEKNFYVDELGGFLPIEYKSCINLARNYNNKNSVEEYWGIWSAVTKNKSQSKVDSVIHALGMQRTVAADSLAENKPDIIITTRPDFSKWQAWREVARFA